MHNRTNLYYIAAAATVILFIIALIGLSSCGAEDASVTDSQDPAILNAYQQGYMDGYSKGYAEGWTASIESNGANAESSSCTSANSGCGSSVPSDTEDEDE